MNQQAIVNRFLAEAEGDFVGIWQIAKAVECTEGEEHFVQRVQATIGALLGYQSIVIGQFRDGTFVQWRGSAADQISRIGSDLTLLDRKPDIGDICWIVHEKFLQETSLPSAYEEDA